MGELSLVSDATLRKRPAVKPGVANRPSVGQVQRVWKTSSRAAAIRFVIKMSRNVPQRATL
jgi:hypothetical protein